jgi:hypothetical protein
MDSKQCLIQCPNCQPIQCPINSQGLYLLLATAYNTIDEDEYIDRANQARFATAALALADDKQSEHMNEVAAAVAALIEQEEPPEANESDTTDHNRTAIEDDGAVRPVSELSEQGYEERPRRSNTAKNTPT